MPGSGLLRSLQESDGVNLPRSGFVQQIEALSVRLNRFVMHDVGGLLVGLVVW